MIRLRWLILGIAAGFMSSAAMAFQETKGGPGGAQPSAGAVAPGLSDLNLKDTGTSVAPSSGVEVRIPGLGRLGVLPKFDFGLDLLYGLNEQKSTEGSQQGPKASDDVQIRGSLKHRW